MPEHRPFQQAPIVPHCPPPVHIVVAHSVEHVRRIEELLIPLEHALHAKLVLDGPDVCDALDLPVVPEQGLRGEAWYDPCKLWKIGRGDVQVDGGMHVLLVVEPVLPDLAIEELYDGCACNWLVPVGELACLAVGVPEVIVEVEHVRHRVA